LFVTPLDRLPVVHAACSRAVADREHRRSARLVEKAGIATDGDSWLSTVKTATVETLAARGEATAAELALDVPELRNKIPQGKGTSWEGTQSVSSLVLAVLSAEAAIVRGRPRGSWLSNQYRWSPMRDWVGPGGIDQRSTQEAQADLARAWLAVFGPATMQDLKWWTGWTITDTRRAVAAIDAVPVELEPGGTGYLLADDLEPSPGPGPWVALLPTLDPTIMGWTERDWYVGDYAAMIFDTAGNAGPTVWCDGRVVGAWALRDDGEVVHRLFEPIGDEATVALTSKAQELTRWFSDRVRPRFRTAIERAVLDGT
jgi:hypothetical protein